MRKKNTGRRASHTERAHAKKIVELYRLAQESPGGMYCLNPESPPEDQDYFYADVEELLGILEDFAEHGTFEQIYQVDFDVLEIHFAVKDLRDSGLTYENAVVVVADKFHKSCRQIQRELKAAREMWPDHILVGKTKAEWDEIHPIKRDKE